MTTGGKRVVLSLKRKIELIDAIEDGQKQKHVASAFGVSANTASVIMKSKERYREHFFSGQVHVNQKRARQAQHDDVENELLKWYCLMRGKGVPVRGPLMKATASSIASHLGKSDWECNDGWLSRFKKRHNIVFSKNVCLDSESQSAGDSTCIVLDQWIVNVLAKTLERYRPCDIFNADETGLFWRLLPDKTMAFTRQICHCKKTAKDRITILCCANMDGSCKWPLFVIGKFKTPRCFKGLQKLPVCYDSNNKAWMTGHLFSEWLQEFDRKMHLEQRRVLLVVDNCTAHPKELSWSLRATELLFLPPNLTDKTQPCNMGIIKHLKCHYRTALLKRLTNHVDAENMFDTFKLSLLDAVQILKQSWERVEPATIYNCFKKAGFVHSVDSVSGNELTPGNTNNGSFSVNLLEQLFQTYGVTAPITDVEGLDDEIQTSPEPSEIYVTVSTKEEEGHEGPESESIDDQGDEMATVTQNEAMEALGKMEIFFLQNGIADDSLVRVHKAISRHKEKGMKQSTITQFFKVK